MAAAAFVGQGLVHPCSFPPGPDYVAAFFGCLYAGVVAVPAYPPQRQRGVPRVRAILADSRAQFALSTTSVCDVLKRVSETGAD
ncbi:MAG: AMP-binding protein [Nitrospira sp.]|nr:AMP-binding protein [Nitrospira sp.]